MTNSFFKKSPRYRRMKQIEKKRKSEAEGVDVYTKARNFKTRDEMKDRLANIRAHFTDNNNGGSY